MPVKSRYLQYIRDMPAYGIECGDRLQRDWENAPPETRNTLGALGVIDAFGYTVTGDETHAENAMPLLSEHTHLLDEYIRVYQEVASAPAMSPAIRTKIEARIAQDADPFLTNHVEWGAMNQATNYTVNGK